MLLAILPPDENRHSLGAYVAGIPRYAMANITRPGDLTALAEYSGNIVRNNGGSYATCCLAFVILELRPLNGISQLFRVPERGTASFLRGSSRRHL